MGDLEVRFGKRVPAGDERERLICDHCGFVRYENPKVVVGSVVLQDDRLLLCRRAIEPRRDFWTLPAGFLENGESPEEGAKREAYEEAYAKIVIDDLFAIYTVRHINQIQMMFRAHFETPDFKPGPESLEVRLFSWDEIPWDLIAFPSVRWALEDYRDRLGQEPSPPIARAGSPVVG